MAIVVANMLLKKTIKTGTKGRTPKMGKMSRGATKQTKPTPENKETKNARNLSGDIPVQIFRGQGTLQYKIFSQ
jgi:hypothetical protein